MAVRMQQIQTSIPEVTTLPTLATLTSHQHSSCSSTTTDKPAVVVTNIQQQPTANNGNSNNNNTTTLKRKTKHERNSRKRSKSFSSSSLGKIMMMNMKPVLPTKFLLGGNINDPLNLNSLQDEKINRAMNAVTPKSSPIPTPPRSKGQIQVIIPPNIHDPLHLIDCADDAEYEQQMCSTSSSSPLMLRKIRKKRVKKKRALSTTLIELEPCGDAGGISSTLSVATTTTTTTIPNVVLTAEATTPESSRDAAKIPQECLEENRMVSVQVQEATTAVTAEQPPKVDVALQKEAVSSKTQVKQRRSEEYTVPAKKFKHSMDKIVSPVVPQPGSWVQRSSALNDSQILRRNQKCTRNTMPQFKEKSKRFQYGNYNRYYGYRTGHREIDPRLKLFSNFKDLFDGKDILDIGCNIGHLTLSIGRDFGAKSITGIDIDPHLIGIARKNIKHYVVRTNKKTSSNGSQSCEADDVVAHRHAGSTSCEFVPISMPILYGAVDIPGFVSDENTLDASHFPHNVTFKTCNYILDDDALLSVEQQQFDVVLCLSVTKWMHLNWGDAGLKQAFRRMYAQLRPGGRLILEPQNWTSYRTKKKLTETIYKHYNSIEFYPEKFTEYLLSSVVGFAKSEILGCPYHKSNGFRRPIQIFTKSTMFPSERLEATPNNANATYTERSSKPEQHLCESQSGQEHVYCTSMLSGSRRTFRTCSRDSDTGKSRDQFSDEDSSNNSNNVCTSQVIHAGGSDNSPCDSTVDNRVTNVLLDSNHPSGQSNT